MGRVAIIIPSKNRIDYCISQIRYYKKNNFDGLLVIVDSSSKSNFSKLEKESKKLNFTNLKLLHNSLLSTHQAIEFGLKQVENECQYYVVSGDDDFFVPNGIYKAASFLDLNSNFLGIIGKAITTKHIKLQNGLSIGWVRTYWKPRSFSNEDRLTRVNQVSRHYINLEFAVKRISSFKDQQTQLSQVFGNVEFNESTDLEICTTLAIALTGKIKFVRTKYLIRGDHDARPNLARKPNCLQPIGVRRENFILYLNCVLGKWHELPTNLSENIIDDYFNLWQKKNEWKSTVFGKMYFLFVKVIGKLKGIILKVYYQKYLKSFIDL